MRQELMVSGGQCLYDPFSLVKHLAENKLPTNAEDADEKHLLALLSEYERVGAKSMVKQTSLKLAGHRMEKKDLFLFQIVRDREDQIELYKYNKDGMSSLVGNDSDTRWRKTSLTRTIASIPLEILQKLPEGSGDKLTMFESYRYHRKVPDPIIAVPVNKKMFHWMPRRLFIGIVKW